MPHLLAFNVEYRFQDAMYAVILRTAWSAHQAIFPNLDIVKVVKSTLQVASSAMFWAPYALFVIMDMHYLLPIPAVFLAPFPFPTAKIV